MRKVSLFAALVVAMTAVSCVKDMNVNTPENSTDGPVAFKATFGAVSKAVLEVGSEESKVAWEAADQVGVLVDEGNYLYTAQTAGYTTTLSTEATDVPAEGTYYAVFPYDEEATLEGNVITTSLPATQTAVLNSFSSHLSVSKAAENSFTFRNVCGLVRVNVASAGVTKVTFAGNSNENVAGSIKVTVSGEPTWEAVEGATTLELVPAGDATELARGDYYLAVLPQTFAEGITVTAYKGENAWDVRKTSTSLTIERSDMKNSNPFGVVGSGTEADPYLLDSALDLVEMRALAPVGGETWFKMTKDIDLTGVNWIPVNYDEGFARKIHFDGGNFTISNLTCDKAKSGADYASFFGVLYGTCKNLKFNNAKITSTNGCGVLGGYVGTTGLPAVVENVTITNSSVENKGAATGGVCGNAREATFKNVTYHGNVTSTLAAVNSTGAKQAALVGGFAGQTLSTSAFENCSVDVIVNAKADDAAGFVGKVQGETVFTGCINNKVAVTTTGRRCGGFIGWNSSTKTTITNCSVVKGSTVKYDSSSAGATMGGFIGYGDTNNTVLVIDGCSSDVTVSAGATDNVGAFMGYAGYASDVTIKNSFSAGSVTSTGSYVGGFIGRFDGDQKLLIENCHSTATVQGKQCCGGFVGYMAQKGSKTLTVTKCYATGNLTATDIYTGGFIGYINASNPNLKVENCYAHGNVSGAKKQRSGGFIGCVEKNVTVNCCYSMGDMDPLGPMAGGFIGAARNWPDSHADYNMNADLNITVTNSIAWPSKVNSNATEGQWSSSPMIAVSSLVNTYTNLYYNPEVVVTDPYFTQNWSHPDVSPESPITDEFGGIGQWNSKYNCYLASSYCGRPAPAGSTISSVAKSIGWDETIWDLSGDVPVLK